ncbi:hypothetical protein [Hyphomonas sp.]|uniref:hypothetical protein n=1 Tax=Alphaproteobacteria TaxID=28211 RepID=UPI0032647698
MHLQQTERQAKLDALREAEGFATIEAMLEAAAFDSISPGICIKDDCDGTIEVEPDQDKGWCPDCGSNTIASALILAGII